MKYPEERFEPGTPAIYHFVGGYPSRQQEASGEIVTKDGIKKISLYPDANYAGRDRRVITPIWENVETFKEANERGRNEFKMHVPMSERTGSGKWMVTINWVQEPKGSKPRKYGYKHFYNIEATSKDIAEAKAKETFNLVAANKTKDIETINSILVKPEKAEFGAGGDIDHSDKIKKLQAVVDSAILPQSVKDKASAEIEKLKAEISISSKKEDVAETTNIDHSDKIKKLQAVVNSAMLPQSVKDKAKAEIEKLQGETKVKDNDIIPSFDDWFSQIRFYKSGKIASYELPNGTKGIGDKSNLEWFKSRYNKQFNIPNEQVVNKPTSIPVIKAIKKPVVKVENKLEDELEHYKNILRNINHPSYKSYVKKNVEKIITELEGKISSTTTPKSTSKSLKDIATYITRRNIESIKFHVEDKDYTVGAADFIDGIYVKNNTTGKHIPGEKTAFKTTGGGYNKNTVYIPNRFIKEVMYKKDSGIVQVKGSDILDGIYVKKEFFKGNVPVTKLPKVTRTQFEEEEFEYKKGGSIHKDYLKIVKGIEYKIRYNPMYKKYQFSIDGEPSGEYKKFKEAYEDLRKAI